MDDDDLAALLRSNQPAAALPSFYPTANTQPSPTLDPFANPFASDTSYNPFSGSSYSALPSSGFATNTSNTSDDGFGGFGSTSALPPVLEDRRDTIEINQRLEDVFIAEKLGNGIPEVSPYVSQLSQEGAYGTPPASSSSMSRQGSNQTIVPLEAPPSTSADFGGFGDEDLAYVPPPAAMPSFVPQTSFEETSDVLASPPAFSQPYAPEPLPTFETVHLPSPPQAFSYTPGLPSVSPGGFGGPSTPYSPPAFSSALPSPSPAPHPSTQTPPKTRVLPSSILTDILGDPLDPSEGLKKAFIKSAKPTTPESSVRGTTQSSPSGAEKKPAPYVFRPSKAKGKGFRAGVTPVAPKTLEVKESVKPKAVTQGAAQDIKPSSSNVEEGKGEVQREQSLEKSDQQEEKPGLSTTAERVKSVEKEVSLPEDPDISVETSKAHEISPVDSAPASTPEEPPAAPSKPTAGTESKLNGEDVVENEVQEVDLSALPPLPESEAGTPRSGTPVPRSTTPPPAAEAPIASILQPPAQEASPILPSPATASTLPSSPPPTHRSPSSATSPIKYDRVYVSPLDPAQPQSYERGFSSFSNGAGQNGGSETYQTATSAASAGGASWGRSFEDTEEESAHGGWSNEPQQNYSNGNGFASAGRVYGDQAMDHSGASGSGWGGSPTVDTVPLSNSPTRPLAERTVSSLSVRSPSTPGKGRLRSQPMFTISVGDPAKVGDPIRGHVVYTIVTRTTSPHYKRSETSVLRRFSDFLWLFEAISLNNPGVIVPPVPDKHPFGRFEDTFIETRRAALERCLGKMANHPVLGLDLDLRLFLESDSFASDIKHRRQEMTQEKQGILSSLSIGGPRFQETDEWFDQKKTFLDSLEAQLKFLVKSVETTSKQRLDLASSTADFSTSISLLSDSSLSPQLSQSLGRLAELLEKEKDVLESQAKMDVVALLSTADEYLRLIASVRLAFASRIKSYHTYAALESDSKKIKVAHEKLRKSGKISVERLQPAMAEMAEADRRVIDAHSDFDAVSRLVKLEFARFEAERVENFKTMLENYLEGMIQRQKEVVAGWEGFYGVLGRLRG